MRQQEIHFGVRFFCHGFDIGDGLLDRQPRVNLNAAAVPRIAKA